MIMYPSSPAADQASGASLRPRRVGDRGDDWRASRCPGLPLICSTGNAIPPLPVRLDATATLEEWLAHPEGGPALREAVGVDDNGRPRGILGEPELITVIGNFPLARLAAFGMGIEHGTVAELTRRFASES